MVWALGSSTMTGCEQRVGRWTANAAGGRAQTDGRPAVPLHPGELWARVESRAKLSMVRVRHQGVSDAWQWRPSGTKLLQLLVHVAACGVGCGLGAYLVHMHPPAYRTRGWHTMGRQSYLGQAHMCNVRNLRMVGEGVKATLMLAQHHPLL